MKKLRVLALALSFFMVLSTSSCLSWEDKKEGNGNPKNEAQEKEESSAENGKKKQSDDAVLEMALANAGDVVSEKTPYFSATPVRIYEAKEGESFYTQGSIVTEQGIYMMLSISNDTELNKFYEEVADKEWTTELEEMYREADRKYRRTELFILDIDGQLKTSVDISSMITEEIEYIETVRATSSGELFLLGSGKYDEKTGMSPRYVIKLDADGNQVGDPILLVPEKVKAGETKHYNYVTWDNHDNFIVSGYMYPENGGEGKGFIDILDPDGKLLFTLEDESGKGQDGWQFNDIIFADKDKVYTAISYFNNTGDTLAEIDFAGKKLGEEIKVDMYLWQATVKDGKIYASDTSGLQCFNFEDQSTESIFYWKDLDLNISGDSATISVISEDTMFLTYDNYNRKTGTPNMEWYILKRDAVNPNAGKKIIQIGGYYIGSSSPILEVIESFNKKNPDYRVEVMDYAFINEMKSKTDYEEIEKTMNMMILSGEIPDILIGNSYNLNFPLYASKDLFVDLNTFIANDDSFHKEDFVDLIFSLPAIDDKLYYTFTSFSIDGLMTSKSVLNGKTGWTLTELEALIDSSGAAETIFAETSHSRLVYQFINPALSSIVDMTSKKANFGSDYFKQILNFCKKYGVEDAMMDEKQQIMMASGMMVWTDPMLQIKNGEIPFLFDNCYSAQRWKTNWNTGGSDITFTGIPGENENHIICTPDTFVAIAKDRQNQDVAWELVKALFDLETQKDTYYGFPVLLEALDQLLEEQKKPETDSYLAKLPEYAPLSDEGAKELREIVQKATKMSTYNTQIIDIIVEESEAFFADQKDIDATVKVIQGRVTTYLNQL